MAKPKISVQKGNSQNGDSTNDKSTTAKTVPKLELLQLQKII